MKKTVKILTLLFFAMTFTLSSLYGQDDDYSSSETTLEPQIDEGGEESEDSTYEEIPPNNPIKKKAEFDEDEDEDRDEGQTQQSNQEEYYDEDDESE